MRTLLEAVARSLREHLERNYVRSETFNWQTTINATGWADEPRLELKFQRPGMIYTLLVEVEEDDLILSDVDDYGCPRRFALADPRALDHLGAELDVQLEEHEAEWEQGDDDE